MTVVRPVRFDSQEHRATLALRQKVMRERSDPFFTRDEIESERADTHLAALQGSAVVGCVVLTALPDDLLQMRQLAVHPDHQRTGVGTLLVRAAEEYARKERARAVVFYPRDEAIPFYLALGYALQADWFEPVGVPIQMMAKRLEPPLP